MEIGGGTLEKLGLQNVEYVAELSASGADAFGGRWAGVGASLVKYEAQNKILLTPV